MIKSKFDFPYRNPGPWVQITNEKFVQLDGNFERKIEVFLIDRFFYQYFAA